MCSIDISCLSTTCCGKNSRPITASRSSSCCGLANSVKFSADRAPKLQNTCRRLAPKSTCSSSQTVDERKPVEVEHTDVVVVGNGPSGICLSYVLSGHWPYYTGEPHSNELLTLRLQSVDKEKSLLLQDLPFLSDGLEGRTSSPVALLVDALCNPDADLGCEKPSLLRWEFNKECAVSHVVLGLNDEGGTWQTIDDDIQSVSLGEWMELPDMSFRKWRETFRRENASFYEGKTEFRANRATAFEVRNYYSNYVDAKGLRPYFRNRSLVTSINRVHGRRVNADCESGEEMDADASCGNRFMWEVIGMREICDPKTGKSEMKRFCYLTPSVVLANGAFDLPNALRVPGEDLSYILHSLPELDSRIRRGKISKNGDPVVVIGAGLSAADAIYHARSADLPVAHIFRQRGHDPLAVFRQLPPTLYPEYDAVHQLMRQSGAQSTTGSDYLSFPAASIVEFTAKNEVILKLENSDELVVIRASYVVILIGSRPNLTFLNGDENEIGRVPGVTIDGKRNPVDVDAYTYQSTRRPGLYAVGPLVGDNFVRFLRGGAIGVAAHIWSNQKEPSCVTHTTKL